MIRWGLFWLSYLLCVINRVLIRCLKLDNCFWFLFVSLCEVASLAVAFKWIMDVMLGIVRSFGTN